MHHKQHEAHARWVVAELLEVATRLSHYDHCKCITMHHITNHKSTSQTLHLSILYPSASASANAAPLCRHIISRNTHGRDAYSVWLLLLLPSSCRFPCKRPYRQISYWCSPCLLLLVSCSTFVRGDTSKTHLSVSLSFSPFFCVDLEREQDNGRRRRPTADCRRRAANHK